jgi:hypothetical protein
MMLLVIIHRSQELCLLLLLSDGERCQVPSKSCASKDKGDRVVMEPINFKNIYRRLLVGLLSGHRLLNVWFVILN